MDRPVPRDLAERFLVAAALHEFDRVRHFVERAGLHPDTTYGGKPTALCYAVLKPHHGLMEFLVARDADCNRADAMGMTPLHYAALGGCETCVAYLIHHGARLNVQNRAGKTPLGLAAERPLRDDCRQLLWRHGASTVADRRVVKRFH
ncbi:MAG: ankyrin repeat domain-containing protein [Hyphomicrobiales bacterium]|nr:ankyrin repeat domain-containing protein [Hyphomicrobiales bacterium]